MLACCTAIDLFPRRVHLYLPSGQDKFHSTSGLVISFLYMATLLATFGAYVQQELEFEETNLLSLRPVVRLMGEFGGLAFILYALFWAIARLCSRN